MQQGNQQLLILADLSPDFQLCHLQKMANDSALIIINLDKYTDLDLIEVIIDGVACTISQHAAEEVRCSFSGKQIEHVFCGTDLPTTPAIGISLGNAVVDGKHLNAVNKSLLELAAIIGRFINAQTVLWCPSSIHTGFEYFSEMANQYTAGGPHPILLQIAILQSGKGQFETRGLDYFAGEEIQFQVPQSCPNDKALKRLAGLIHNAVARKERDTSLSEQMLSGENLSYVSRSDQAALGAASRTF